MSCHICRSEKHCRPCSECEQEACRDCTVIFDKESFRYHPKQPKFIQQTHFCFTCQERVVQPALDEYNEIAARAKEVTIVTKAFRGPVPILKQKHEFVRVKDHLDEFFAISHLKFLAALNGYDSLVDVETKWTKVRRHGYEHKEWAAWGSYANIDKRRFRPDQST